MPQDLDVDMIIDFITANPTAQAINDLRTGGNLSPILLSLQTKFKELTGLNPTPTNLKTVASIDPNREPLRVTEGRNVETAYKRIT